MTRRPKTTRVPRTRAGGTWTEAAFWGFVRSGFRELSKRWPPRRQALIDARQPYTGSNRRRKWSYRCALCGKLWRGTEVQVDHVEPCGRLASWADVELFLRRLLCEVDGLRVLCKGCHKRNTGAPCPGDGRQGPQGAEGQAAGSTSEEAGTD